MYCIEPGLVYMDSVARGVKIYQPWPIYFLKYFENIVIFQEHFIFSKNF